MLINTSEYLKSVVKVVDYPNHDMPQYLLMGRSNVGKSSFINALANRKKLAYTSSKPGKTQTLNFYLMNNEFMLVDAPGYGYAKTAKESRVDFGGLIENYLNSDVNCKGVFLIIDIRHEPSEDDKLVFEFLKQFDLNLYVIATKVDKIGKSFIQRQTNMIKKSFNMDMTDKIYVFSSETKFKIEEIENILKK
jgi:GTP-binding protein